MPKFIRLVIASVYMPLAAWCELRFFFSFAIRTLTRNPAASSNGVLAALASKSKKHLTLHLSHRPCAIRRRDRTKVNAVTAGREPDVHHSRSANPPQGWRRDAFGVVGGRGLPVHHALIEHEVHAGLPPHLRCILCQARSQTSTVWVHNHGFRLLDMPCASLNMAVTRPLRAGLFPSARYQPLPMPLW